MRNQQKNSKQDVSKIDYGIILAVMLLAIISIVTLYSTMYLMSSSPAIRPVIMQVAWYAVGTIVAIIMMNFDSEQL